MTSTKSNGDPLEGTIVTPSNYPSPVDHNVNMHPIDWSLGDGNKLIDVAPPTAPVLSASSGTALNVVLNWTASTDGGSGLDHYELWDKGVAVYAPIPTNVRTYAHTDGSGTAHAFVVKAVDARGNVATSNSVSFTTS